MDMFRFSMFNKIIVYKKYPYHKSRINRLNPTSQIFYEVGCEDLIPPSLDLKTLLRRLLPKQAWVVEGIFFFPFGLCNPLATL
jgi:hypothetical protein